MEEEAIVAHMPACPVIFHSQPYYSSCTKKGSLIGGAKGEEGAIDTILNLLPSPGEVRPPSLGGRFSGDFLAFSTFGVVHPLIYFNPQVGLGTFPSAFSASFLKGNLP